jgi:pyrophosphate--fructose-6-phosphate 1-phosphotransferase
MKQEVSPLEQTRLAYQPRLPRILSRSVTTLGLTEGEPTSAVGDETELRERFPRTFGRPELHIAEGSGPPDAAPLKVGVVLSGGQAPGGHNVIAGLFDGLKAAHPNSRLVGFLGGPGGVLSCRYEELTGEKIAPYRNTGGFDLIGSGRDKIETEAQLAASRESCEELGLDGLVIIGGDDSNTNAAVLAEYFQAHGVEVTVNGVPKTIDGDLKGEKVESSFGFDTATRVYSELIGNICRDAKSAAKYWHFIKLMGRSASHVTLECALRTRVNIALIGEEVEERALTLRQVVQGIVDAVQRRSEAGKNYGICLVPEGLIEFIPEIRALIGELNTLLSEHAKYFETLQTFLQKQEFVNQTLSKDSSYVFSSMPTLIQAQLLLERDAHGNVQVSKIDTEQLLVELVEDQIAQRKAEGGFPGKFQVQAHFLGYEGRCAAPTNFDADYTYTLGTLAAVLAVFRKTGYICGVAGLVGPTEDWLPLGVPLTSMMQMEQRKGKPTPVIGKALVRTAGAPFVEFARCRDQWEAQDEYLYPGPIQYFGPDELSDARSLTLTLEQEGRGDP